MDRGFKKINNPTAHIGPDREHRGLRVGKLLLLVLVLCCCCWDYSVTSQEERKKEKRFSEEEGRGSLLASISV